MSATESNYTPPEVFHVRGGQRFRFRMISAAGMGCVFRVSVDKHRVTAIAADGAPIKAVHADSVTIAGGKDVFMIQYWIFCKRLNFGTFPQLKHTRNI